MLFRRNPESTPRVIERTAHDYELYKAAFGQVIDNDQIETIADIGAGDADFAYRTGLEGKMVSRIDADYAKTPPEGGDWYPYDATDMSNVPDNQYDAVISSFMMQHMSSLDQERAIEEMVRISKSGESNKGLIGIFPVYKPKKLAHLLAESGFTDALEARVVGNWSRFSDSSIELRRLGYDTLWIHKRDSLTLERTHEIAQIVGESGALYRRTTPGDLARRAFKPAGVYRV